MTAAILITYNLDLLSTLGTPSLLRTAQSSQAQCPNECSSTLFCPLYQPQLLLLQITLTIGGVGVDTAR